MAGDADEPGQALVAGAGERLDRPTGTVGDLPFVLLDEVVQLDQVDVVDAHPLERALERGAGGVALPVAGLGGEEDLVAVVGEPRLEADLGLAVRRRGVDVVDARRLDLGEDAVGRVLTGPAEPGGAEDDPGRVVPGPPELRGGEHALDPTATAADRFCGELGHAKPACRVVRTGIRRSRRRRRWRRGGGGAGGRGWRGRGRARSTGRPGCRGDWLARRRSSRPVTSYASMSATDGAPGPAGARRPPLVVARHVEVVHLGRRGDDLIPGRGEAAAVGARLPADHVPVVGLQRAALGGLLPHADLTPGRRPHQADHVADERGGDGVGPGEPPLARRSAGPPASPPTPRPAPRRRRGAATAPGTGRRARRTRPRGTARWTAARARARCRRSAGRSRHRTCPPGRGARGPRPGRRSSGRAGRSRGPARCRARPLAAPTRGCRRPCRRRRTAPRPIRARAGSARPWPRHAPTSVSAG